ncbi:PhzF family phenazine biosynthesis isomerase [Chryseobacterium sp. CH21]|uniref:PhzF family phenazine biosynthesis isomerase n=1 Tax=Chryseobacterium sp. CH21 TaxID=713556 RepID=UPI0021CE552D|nr:PhzF family phenazine biosynthesis isomerase [Chryseobacterium sp. CH21]
MTKLSKEIGCNGYFVFTFDTEEKDILTNGRMFAPAIGISEDPVTGNANGPLGGYLIQNKICEAVDGVFKFTGKQGEAINRIGKVEVQVSVKDHKPNVVRITGNAVSVFRTTMNLK